jgi:hypothetical protein
MIRLQFGEIQALDCIFLITYILSLNLYLYLRLNHTTFSRMIVTSGMQELDRYRIRFCDRNRIMIRFISLDYTDKIALAVMGIFDDRKP